jgi:hypothetical protein
MVVALLTMSMTMATIFYKAPARVAEAGTAFWISLSPDDNGRCFDIARIVLCASIGPLVTIMAIGGFAFIKG